MPGLLGDIWTGIAGDDTTKDEYGQTQADRRMPIWADLMKTGLLMAAGGQRMMPEQRAQYIAQMGQTLGGIPADYQSQQSAVAQNALQRQQLKSSQADLAQKEKWRAYASSPEFLKSLEGLTPAERQIAIGEAMTGKFESVAKFTDPLRQDSDAIGSLKRCESIGIAKEGIAQRPSEYGRQSLY